MIGTTLCPFGAFHFSISSNFDDLVKSRHTGENRCPQIKGRCSSFPSFGDYPFSPSKREIGLFILSFGLIEMEKSKT